MFVGFDSLKHIRLTAFAIEKEARQRKSCLGPVMSRVATWMYHSYSNLTGGWNSRRAHSKIFTPEELEGSPIEASIVSLCELLGPYNRHSWRVGAYPHQARLFPSRT